MQRRDFVTAIACTAAGTVPLRAETSRNIVMATMISPEDGFAARWLQLIYTDAFQQLGWSLAIQLMPAARASAENVAGHVDGELARSFAYGATQPALIRVSEPSFTAATNAYVKRRDIQLQPGWEGLRGSGYRIEYRQGYPIIAMKLAAVVPPARLSGVRNAETGLRKLVLGRSDIYVDIGETVDHLIRRPEFVSEGIRAAATIEREPVHAYLNQKHAALAPLLAAILKKMRESGKIERYRQ